MVISRTGGPVYSLADIIRKRATATPDAIALAEMGRLTSFAALDRRSSQVAQALQAGECGPATGLRSSAPTARSSPKSVPKGVELTGRNLGCALHELHFDIRLHEKSVCAAPIPFFHIAGFGLFLDANLNGGRLSLAHRLRSAGRPMAEGCWRKPEQTAEVLLPGGWLRTGDGGLLRRGRLPLPARPLEGHDRLRR